MSEDLSMTNIVVRDGQIDGLLGWETAGSGSLFSPLDLRTASIRDFIFDKLYPEELTTDDFLGRLTRH